MLRVQLAHGMVKVGFSDKKPSQARHGAACPSCTQLLESPGALVPRSQETKGSITCPRRDEDVPKRRRASSPLDVQTTETMHTRKLDFSQEYHAGKRKP